MKRVLFVHPDHGPRWQMAAALLAPVAGPGIKVSSPGMNPTGDMAGVTGAPDGPYYPSSGEVRRWPFPDPAAPRGRERDELLRRIRDDLAPQIDSLAGELS